MKNIITILFLTFLFVSCGTSEEKSEVKEEKKDSVTTDEADMPVVDEVEMEYVYEVTNTKTKKTVQMSQEEYLASGIWEKSEYLIKEIPLAK